MCWPTWLVVVAVLARKPRARALSSTERHIGPKESTGRHILANQGVLNGISWATPGQSGGIERHILANQEVLNGISMAGSYI
jgi:hypothetical protein